MGILPNWIIERDIKIVPFAPQKSRPGIISYGATSYGYDVRVDRSGAIRMTLLIDESVDGAIVRRMRSDGYDVHAVSELSPSIADDILLAAAVADRRLLITADKDFGFLVHHSMKAHCGIVLLRLAGLKSNDRAELVSKILVERGTEMLDAFTVISVRGLRIRTEPPQPNESV